MDQKAVAEGAAVNYDKKTKKHTCLIEKVRKDGSASDL